MSSFFNALLKSWKTSSAALPAIGLVLIEIGKALRGEDADWPTVIASLSAALGLLFSRDNDVTSETAKAKR